MKKMKKTKVVIVIMCLLSLLCSGADTNIQAKDTYYKKFGKDVSGAQGVKYAGVKKTKDSVCAWVSPYMGEFSKEPLLFDVDQDGKKERIMVTARGIQKNDNYYLKYKIKKGKHVILSGKRRYGTLAVSFIRYKKKVYMTVTGGDNDLSDGKQCVYLLKKNLKCKKLLQVSSKNGWDYLQFPFVGKKTSTGKKGLFICKQFQCQPNSNYNRLSKKAKKIYGKKLRNSDRGGWFERSVTKYCYDQYKLKNGKLQLVEKNAMYTIGYAYD